MKKLCVSKKILVVGIIAVVFSLCICAIGGCSGGSGQGDGQIESNFQGSWKLSGMSEGGQTYSQEDIKLIEQMGGSCSLTLNEDKTCDFEFFGETESGTWSAKDASTCTISVSNSSTDCTLKDGQLVLEADGSSLTFTKQK